ncbi:WecB/TagA/CpsF family glycosyltransferase [Gordonia alkanivorans]|uniref:WecB/TagA/CpsF family glycosyltransferase n=1 Tax=Gordonia alkanivorans TaxID=84096 RepID=UPI0034DFD566
MSKSADEPSTADLAVDGTVLRFSTAPVSEVADTIRSTRPDIWSPVITPNLHILRVASFDGALENALACAAILLPDGWPVAWLLSRATGWKVERATGADLLERLLDTPGIGQKLVLVGGSSAESLRVVADRARSVGWIVDEEPAPPSEVNDLHARRLLVERLSVYGDGGIVVLGLGAPKQELLAGEIAARPGGGWILCVGMAINFSAGTHNRAPILVQKARLEWLYRVAQEPRRLLKRYARDAVYLAKLAISGRKKEK